MGYVCVDRGTSKCPCILMESGQCYTCGMISRGKCDCLSSWQGVCPYTEYIQKGAAVEKGAIKSRDKSASFEVKGVEDFSGALKVITLSAPAGFVLKCSRAGAFLMVGADGHKVPLSVMECGVKGDPYVKTAMYVTGPKTMILDDMLERGNRIEVWGPFFGGLKGIESFDPKRLSLVAAKGIALMPLLNGKGAVGSGLLGMYLDETKLTKEFLLKYVGDLEYRRVSFEEGLEEVSCLIREDIEYCLRNTGEKPNVFLMVSPYYRDKFLELCELRESEIITPNHANMCCGEGLCGACSYTDSEGVTVRRCKCIDG